MLSVCRKSPKTTPQPLDRAGKKPRVWELGGNNKDIPSLDRSKDKEEDARSGFRHDDKMIGTMSGVIQDLEVEESEEEDDDESDDGSSGEQMVNVKQRPTNVEKTNSKQKGGSMFSIFKSLVGSKNLSRDDMQPALDKLRDHLIGKNVASDIAYKVGLLTIIIRSIEDHRFKSKLFVQAVRFGRSETGWPSAGYV